MVDWKSLIGTPYRLGGIPPQTFDCWQLIKYVSKHCLHRDYDTGFDPSTYTSADIPDYMLTIKDTWQVVHKPHHGDVILLGDKRMTHCGIVMEGGLLHAMDVNSRGQVFYHSMSLITRMFRQSEVYRCLA